MPLSRDAVRASSWCCPVRPAALTAPLMRFAVGAGVVLPGRTTLTASYTDRWRRPVGRGWTSTGPRHGFASPPISFGVFSTMDIRFIWCRFDYSRSIL